MSKKPCLDSPHAITSQFPSLQIPNPNPRTPMDRPAAPPPPAPAPHILDRFRAMVRIRQDELRDSADEEGAEEPLSTAEIVGLYQEVLDELVFNSKPVITELTMIAGDHREHAEGIAEAICQRILKVPVDQKLPSLYLLDSIVKNIGREYVKHFGTRLPKVFCEAYNAVNSNLHQAMRHLFGTWSQVFHPSVICRIEDELEFTTSLSQKSTALAQKRHSESPSPRPSHGIHVNPKYLEARRQFENHAAMCVIDSHSDDMTDVEGEQVARSASESLKGWSGASPKFHDVQQPKGVSSGLQVYGPEPSVQYDHYDFDDTEVLPTRTRMSGVGSSQSKAVYAPTIAGFEGTVTHLKSRVARPTSPLRYGLTVVDNRFQMDSSPEKASPSGLEWGHTRVTDQNSQLERRWLSEDGVQQRERSIGYNPDNGHAEQRSRELIDAYGNYRETGDFHERPSKFQRLDVSGINSKASTRNWQSSEEEEYMWEDMSPTLADRSNKNRLHPFGNGRPCLNRFDERLVEPEYRRSSWRDETLLPPVDVEDRIPASYFDRGSMKKRYIDGVGGQDESLLHYQSSNHLQEPGKFPYGLSRNSLRILSPKSQGRSLQVPYAGSGMISSFVRKLPGPYDYLPEAEVTFRGLPSITGNLNVERPVIERHLAQRPNSSPRRSPIAYPPAPKSEMLPLLPIPSNQNQFIHGDFVEGNKPVLNQGPNSSFFLPWQQYHAADRKPTISSTPLQFSHQIAGSVHARQHNQQLSSARLQPQVGCFPQPSSHFPPFLNQLETRRQDLVAGSELTSPLSRVPAVGVHSTSNTTYVHGGNLPPLPPLPTGPPPVSSQLGPASQSISSSVSNSPASSYSDLLGKLVAQGLIMMTPPGQPQDSVGLEFDMERLKVRHEPVVDALYFDLPRQCTTCGMRFKCQEEHSSHMDWHVTKNRTSKNRKQKPSRKWFVNAKEWLSGAEILGTDMTSGFLPSETVPDKKEDKEMDVPADENQNVCALCGELFEDFYSDETEEWMYKGAVYMNAPNGNIEGLERSLLGPIVHAKCRSESAEDTGQQ